MVQVIADQVINMVPMRYGFMTAVRPMDMFRLMRPAIVIRCAFLRIRSTHSNGVLVYVVAMDVMQVAVVEVIDVAVVLYARMATALVMNVVMAFMFLTRHRSSPLGVMSIRTSIM